MKIFIGADHRGVGFKARIKGILQSLGYDVIDVGTNDETKGCDYPKIGFDVASRVARSRNGRGILMCMSGIGQSIVANKVKGAYAALCYNAEAAKLSRQHNNANVLVLSAKFVKSNQLKKILTVWLTTEFEGGRHQRRVNQIKKIERSALPL